jgi:hypothetical protein
LRRYTTEPSFLGMCSAMMATCLAFVLKQHRRDDTRTK